MCGVPVSLLQYESSGLGLISSRLRTTLNRIQESLIDMVKKKRKYAFIHLSVYLLLISPWLSSYLCQ